MESTGANISVNRPTSSIEEQCSQFCDECFDGFTLPKDFVNHVFNKHDGPCCFRCDLIFSDYEVFTTHMRERHNVKHLCMFCPEAYDGLMYHRNDADTHYQCLYCHKVYRTLKKLYNHLRIHDKPFTCPNCFRKFNTKNLLRRHFRHLQDVIK